MQAAQDLSRVLRDIISRLTRKAAFRPAAAILSQRCVKAAQDLSRLLRDIISRLTRKEIRRRGDILSMLKGLIDQTCWASATQGKPQRFPLVFLIPIKTM